MKKSIDKLNCINKIGTFQSKDAAHGRTSARCRPIDAVIYQLPHFGSKSIDLEVCKVNVGISEVGQEILLRCQLERMPVDISCVQEARFRGKVS